MFNVGIGLGGAAPRRLQFASTFQFPISEIYSRDFGISFSSVIAPELSTCSSGNSSKSFFNSKREICRRRFVGEKKVELNDSLSSDRNPITLQKKEGNESRVTGACVLNAFMQMLDFYHNFQPFIHVVGIRKFIPFQTAHIRGNFAW